LRGYYTVYNPRGEKIADCGAERDALNLMAMRNNRWDGHYYTFIPLPGEIVDVSSRYQLESVEVGYEPVNDDPQDGWWLHPEWNQDILPESDLETFDPGYHD